MNNIYVSLFGGSEKRVVEAEGFANGRRGMARELELAVDWDPVRESDIPVYSVAGKLDHPTVTLEATAVALAPFKEMSVWREYMVEVEFVPDDLTIDDEGFVNDYLGSYKNAKVTQEGMARKVRIDLREALGLDDVFVQVQRKAPADKRARVGAP